MEVHKNECFTECVEEEFKNALYNFHGFKDNYIVFANKSKKNRNQRNIIIMKNSKIQNKEDSVKRGTVSWEEALFLAQKHLK